MKKLILLISLAIVSICASAQLNPVQKIEASREVASARMKTVRLVRMQHAYVLFIYSTGNQFDKAATFVLGDTKNSALETMSDMLGLLESLEDKESVVVVNNERKVILTKRVMMGNSGFYFKMPDIAGKNTCITKKELVRLNKALLSDKE